SRRASLARLGIGGVCGSAAPARVEHTSAISREAPLVARDASGTRYSTWRRARSPSPWVIPFKAAMLRLEWPEVRRLFDERERRRRLAEAWAGARLGRVQRTAAE